MTVRMQPSLEAVRGLLSAQQAPGFDSTCRWLSQQRDRIRAMNDAETELACLHQNQGAVQLLNELLGLIEHARELAATLSNAGPQAFNPTAGTPGTDWPPHITLQGIAAMRRSPGARE